MVLPDLHYMMGRRRASLHAQVEVTSVTAPALPLEDAYVDATVHRVFRGADELPLGSTVRFNVSVYKDPEYPMIIGPARYLAWESLVEGLLFEVFLNGTPPNCSLSMWQFQRLDHLTERPMMSLERACDDTFLWFVDQFVPPDERARLSNRLTFTEELRGVEFFDPQCVTQVPEEESTHEQIGAWLCPDPEWDRVYVVSCDHPGLCRGYEGYYIQVTEALEDLESGPYRCVLLSPQKKRAMFRDGLGRSYYLEREEPHDRN